MNRRHFLMTTAIAAQAQTPTGAPARLPRLIPGCCAYSYGSYLGKGKMTMEEFILKAVDLCVLGVEITTYWLKSTDPAYLAGLRSFGYRHGIDFYGLSIGAQMCQPDGAKRKEVLDGIYRWVDATDRLGASHLRVFGDRVPEGATEAQGIQWVAETMKAACEYSGKKGITLGVETHMGLTVRGSNVLEILRRVDSPYAGCTLDISNWRDNPYEHIAACLPYATNAHIRDTWGDPPQPLDLDRIWQMFARAGYQGYMSAEYEGKEDPLTGVPKLVDRIRTLCRKYSSA